ncbi:ring-hydroxylating oxygenase subunit alpha [Chenggangzhangella methanolivorans]|uniref:Ring-hydroxylating oxygenase subunit alpha n=1 Tax=Chenggangzhangella methanolivorans TaxID=1437009 RepID=A0A9E6RDC4_9HYPH|nr:ring-hydroxylating oxygenase subunit alpha [Chenggangzhangella methanolivorans]QZN98985.1 ring-hydroxylating oxygenase subunit alpha [Chenggangzhangella methanolivorans]
MSHRPDLGFFDEGHDLAGPAFYADAIGDGGKALMLPPAAVRSLAFTHLEDEAVWTRDWICVGSHEAIPNVGDLLPFTVGVHGVHVQRTDDGLAARFNKAQHGGCRAIPLQCQTGAKTKCSFTSCGYSRDRRAIPATELGDGTPEMHQYLGLRPERLLSAQAKSWGPLIFVNLDVAPDWPEQSLRLLGRTMGAFGNHKAERSSELWLEYPANWKLLGTALAEGEPIGEDRRGGWTVSTTTLADGQGATVAWLFPNLVLISTETETAVAVLQQTAIGQTLCRLSVYGAAPEASMDRWRAEIEERAANGVEAHRALSRFGTSHRPETIGQPLPAQTSPLAAWMQRTLADRVARAPLGPIDQPLFQNPKG